ncbi:MAG: hypothetical protein H7Y03_13360 [Chitinophagaceae bacterium]|nr:hypothetical protein [Chitinophagaceae bacterium]
MKYSKWIGIAGSVLLIIACMLPWVTIESRNIVATGLRTDGTSFGKPGLMNLILAIFATLFFLLPKIWAKRTNLFVCGFNLAWAVRNYIIVSGCFAGECPDKETGLYLLILSAVIMVTSAVFPDLELKKED